MSRGKAGPEANYIWKLGPPLPFPLWGPQLYSLAVRGVQSLYKGFRLNSQYCMDPRSHLPSIVCDEAQIPVQ